MKTKTIDLEAEALGKCYAYLLRKAAERRARLAKTAVVAGDEQSIQTDNSSDQRIGLTANSAS